MSGERLPVMWLSIFFEQMLSFPSTVKWISGDALVSLLIFWYGNSRTNSGERRYYLFLAVLEGNSGSGRGEEPEPQQVSAAEAAERDGQSSNGTKEAQTSREIRQRSRYSQKPASEINSLCKMTDSFVTSAALWLRSRPVNKCSSAGSMQAPTCPLQN